MSYSINGAPAKVWNALAWEAVPDFVLTPGPTIVAHNVAFEKAIWRNVLHWPEPARWYDTLATCAMKQLPLKLGEAARVLHLSEQKSERGDALIHLLCKPRKDGSFNEEISLHQEMRDYCVQDTRAELELFRRTGNLGAAEYRVWELDQKINERGVLLDMPYVMACRTLAETAKEPLQREFTELTGIAKAGSQPKCKVWLHARGAPFPDLRRETVDEALEDEALTIRGETEVLYELDEDTLAMLRMRQKLTSTSQSKLQAMTNVVGSDSRARFLLQYHGAGTGRWSGRLIQPQNFPRAKVKGAKVDAVYNTIMLGDVEIARLLFGCPIDLVTTGLRHAIVAGPGKKICARDFSTVEARVCLALAGAKRALAVFNDKSKDIYCENASLIFKTPVEKSIAKDEHHPDHHRHAEWRQTGKNSVLGLGFQMGAPKFKARYAKKHPLEFAQGVVDVYRGEFAPEVPRLWANLEAAAITAVWEKRPCEAYGVEFKLEDGWLTAHLPSGRKLWYFDPKPLRKKMPWSTTERPDIRPAWSYRAKKMGVWMTIDAYGGHLTENVVQALARDLMVAAMFRAEANGFPVILTVHDEIICEPDACNADDRVLQELMVERPPWAVEIGIPVAADDGWTGERYRK